MEWVRLYTVLLTHPKQVRTSPRAWKVLTLAWIYVGQHETDGRLPPEAKAIVGMTPAVERELEELGWLHRNGDGWLMHDWEHHQTPAEDVRRRRDLARERQAKKRRRDREQEG